MWKSKIPCPPEQFISFKVVYVSEMEDKSVSMFVMKYSILYSKNSKMFTPLSFPPQNTLFVHHLGCGKNNIMTGSVLPVKDFICPKVSNS